jgi:hypothetical protein
MMCCVIINQWFTIVTLLMTAGAMSTITTTMAAVVPAFCSHCSGGGGGGGVISRSDNGNLLATSTSNRPRSRRDGMPLLFAEPPSSPLPSSPSQEASNPLLNLFNNNDDDESEDPGPGGNNINAAGGGMSLDDWIIQNQQTQEYRQKAASVTLNPLDLSGSSGVVSSAGAGGTGTTATAAAAASTANTATASSSWLIAAAAVMQYNEMQGFDLSKQNFYLLPLSMSSKDNEESEDCVCDYVMVDVPPFSKELANDIQQFLSKGENENEKVAANNNNKKNSNSRARVAAIFITNKNSICNAASQKIGTGSGTGDQSAESQSESDLQRWVTEFTTKQNNKNGGDVNGENGSSSSPIIEVIMHRHDVERRQLGNTKLVTQQLDGYGPWEYDLSTTGTDSEDNDKFVETGDPLVLLNWSTEKIMSLYNDPTVNATAIALKEANKLRKQQRKNNANNNTKKPAKGESGSSSSGNNGITITAVYTPGHTMGSMSYVFDMGDSLKVCCSGNTLPDAASGGRERMDQLGSMTTASNKNGLLRQVESCHTLLNDYIICGDGGDETEKDDDNTYPVAVLPARGEIVSLAHLPPERQKSFWQDRITQFEKLSRVYTNLGIL